MGTWARAPLLLACCVWRRACTAGLPYILPCWARLCCTLCPAAASFLAAPTGVSTPSRADSALHSSALMALVLAVL